MAYIVRIHCAAGHLMRWRGGRGGYEHACQVKCNRRPDPTKTTWE